MEDYRKQFIELYNANITRPGADRLLNWLETTDFFTAPASTRFHGACECGLVMHSINVYNAMMQHFFTENDNAETFAKMPTVSWPTTVRIARISCPPKSFLPYYHTFGGLDRAFLIFFKKR